MKKCPICNRAYNDPTLNFCLEDGATLVAQTNNSIRAQSFGLQSPALKQKKSHSLVWILGIVGGFLALGVVGIVGLVALIAAAGSGGNSNNVNNRRISNGSNNSNGNIYAPNLKVSNNSNLSVKDQGSVDLTRWSELKTEIGETKLVGDEFQISSLRNDYYYVVIASSKFEEKYLTNNAIVKVTSHSVTGDSPSLGYGLIINSDVEPLKSDYAFLIRSDNQTFRIVRHDDKEETSVVKWTYAPQIRTGTQTNQLEVRSNSDSLTFYINGQLATTVTDESANERGIVGLYTSDKMPVGFSNLQILKN